ncbi:glycolate oxidase subunit GlcE [Magnetovibrio sp. PR-2]|uniref:glycolate oxidase subunit GlcE n=1 Tax=Magnetovibrio sp. PR-2 TaxID=3120356 RepID=UPI002FCE2C77
MTDILKPDNVAQILGLIKWAVAEKSPLQVCGHDTKSGLGAPSACEHILDLSDLSGIELYQPSELVMTAKAGTPVAEVQAALDEAGQMMAFEPWQPGALYGTEGGTVGGLFASAVCGPRRPLAGSARDHLLGFEAISGRGEVFKSGGRVVKNVTGFDLSKLMAGSMGTLSVMTQVTFKVLPKPEKTRTVLVFDPTDAQRAMLDAQNSPYEVSGVAHLPTDIAAKSAVSYIKDKGAGIVAVRVEGPAPSVEVRCQSLRDVLGAYGEVEELHTHNSATLWREVRDVEFFKGDADLWRLSVPPAEGVKIASQLGGTYFLDWAGGLIWLQASGEDAQRIRAAMASGHATLMRGSKDMRRSMPVFQSQSDGLAALMNRVRAGFDPHTILNPGRMGGG